MTIGVLDLQGDVREHVAALERLGQSVRLVTGPGQLVGLAGVVLPGGESTTLSLLLDSAGLFEPLAQAFDAGLPVFGTCAGMILLATEVLDGRGDQRSFGLVDLTVRRNGFGRQLDSFETDLDMTSLGDEPFHAVFIRAPVIERVGPGVEVVAALDDHRVGAPAVPVACRQGPVLVTSFHPELTDDGRLHQLFVEMTKEETR